MYKIKQQIDDYLFWCENIANYTPQTIISKEYILRRIAVQTGIQDIFKLTLDQYLEWKKGMLSGALTGKVHKVETVNTRIKTLRIFMKWAEEFYCKKPLLNFIMIQKVRAISVQVHYTFYTEKQIKIVIQNSKEVEQLMIALFFESGLRISEFQRIKVQDINFSNNSISIIGKGRKQAEVFFSFKTGIKLVKYIKKNNLLSSDFLWRSPASLSGEPYTLKTIRKKLKRSFENCGFYNFHPHQLRHSFATNLAEHGASIYEIQNLLRHSDIRTTQVYLHNLQNKLNDVYHRILNEEVYYLKSPTF